MAFLLSYLLSSMGLTILIVWPQDGPAAWLREEVLRRALPGKAKEVLDCYICTSFWSGLALSSLWWCMCGQPWTLAGCLMTPTLFWIVLRNGVPEETASSGDGS
jgi:hypothetical protein